MYVGSRLTPRRGLYPKCQNTYGDNAAIAEAVKITSGAKSLRQKVFMASIAAQ
jgi:hypothetical protein